MCTPHSSIHGKELCDLTQQVWSRVFIRSWVPGAGTCLLWTECPVTQSTKFEKKNCQEKNYQPQ